MDAIAPDHRGSDLWEALAARVQQGMAQRGLHPARTVVLLPYVQLLPLARQAWAARAGDGFAPRFETTRTWGAASAPEPAAQDISFDVARDLLTARALLERAGLGEQAELLAGRLVPAAAQLASLAGAVPVGERPAWAARARGAAGAGMDFAALRMEAAVARIAVEWAAASSYATDGLLQGDWRADTELVIVVPGLQPDPLTAALQARFAAQVRIMALDEPATTGTVSLHEALDPSDEAERAAACVLRHVNAGRTPVALAATDRQLTRRVRAMLAARGVAIRDETGWRLSTTRAGAHVMAALRACARHAASDAVLDWLKNAPALRPGRVLALERLLRRAGWREWLSVRPPPDGSAAELVAQINGWREGLQRARPLPQWLADLATLLRAAGQWAALARDEAGDDVLAALHLSEAAQTRLQALAPAARRLSLSEFTAWAGEVLEARNFVPRAAAGEQLVILPLAQVMGRPFAALVLPGCDEDNLPASPEPSGPWTAAQRAGLGLPNREALQAAQRAAWRQALRIPHCDVLWRGANDDGEAVLPSALVRLLQVRGQATASADPRDARQLRARPVPRPFPLGRALPPAQLSASAYADLRRCPYRFFALRQLGLKEIDEIDIELDKRDFGNWLHAVLRRFHEAPEQAGETREQRLDRTVAEVTAQQGLDEGEFLPFAAAWPRVRAGYLHWLREHEATGARFAQAEAEREVALGPLKLVGRIDRIDQLPRGTTLVMDYKTEPLKTTRERVGQPGEDTQLAFYAALLPDDTLAAAYVNVGEDGVTRSVDQPEVVAARDALVAGILHDMERIAQGAPLPALGEGMVCETCAARGLCRKDFWA